MKEVESIELKLPISESKSGSYQVTKSNKLIESQCILSANQQKLLSACISQVNPKKKYSNSDDQIRVAFSFDFTREDITRLTGIESKHLTPFLEEAAKKLQELHAHQIDTSSHKRKFKLINLIDKAEFDGDIFHILFTTSVSEELYDLSKVGYTKYLLENIQSLTSQYAIRLYELIQRMMNPRLNKQNCSFILDDFLFCLGIVDFKGEPIVKNSASKFSQFNKDILKPAIIQINKKTDLYIELIEKKRIGRKIGKLVFSVKRTVTIDALIKGKASEIISQIVEQGVDPIQAEEWCDNYEHEIIKNNLKLMNDQEKSGKKIKSKPGYLKFLISNNISGLPDVANPYSSLYSHDKAAQEYVKTILLPAWHTLSEDWQLNLTNNGLQASSLGADFSRWKSEYISNSVNKEEYTKIFKELKTEDR